jgi:tRNA (guanosine-2'-O-)-methyltransferase
MLATESPAAVISCLGDRMSRERRERIDGVVARRTNRLALAMEGVQDPHNTAAVIRTCDAFGVQAVHVIENGIRFLSSKKVTQGSHKWIDLGVWERPGLFADVMREQGKKILVADADGAVPLHELDPRSPMVLVFGNEHEGISPAMRSVAQGSFRIPMFGFVESVNVSVAAAITLAALRGEGGGDLSPAEADRLRARFYLRAVRAGYDIVIREMSAVRRSTPKKP